MDESGTLYLADARSHSIQLLGSNGSVLATWGEFGTAPGQFQSPTGVAVAPDGSVFVSEGEGRVQRLSPSGAPEAHWGTSGDGPGDFRAPGDLAVNPQGTVYVADTWNNRIQAFTRDGAFQASWGRHVGEVSSPRDVALGPDGKLYVVDGDNDRIQRFTPDGTYDGGWGVRGSGPGEFWHPSGIAISSSGTVYVADSSNARIQKFTLAGTYVGEWGSRGFEPEQLLNPRNIAVGQDETVYLTDDLHRVRRFSRDGALMGQWGQHGSGDGDFVRAGDVAVGPDGSVYVSDAGNYRIQRFSQNGTYLGKWGNSTYGDEQYLSSPGAITVGDDGKVYVVTAMGIKQFTATGNLLVGWSLDWGWWDGLAVSGDDVYASDTNKHRITKFHVAPDTTAPTARVETANADPARSLPLRFNVWFDDAVRGFAADDLTVAGTAGRTTAIVTLTRNAPHYYTVEIDGLTSDGTLSVSLPADRVTDYAGNPNTASVSADNEITYDATAPVATITSPATQASHVQGQQLAAEFACTDGGSGSGIASCTGEVDGAAVASGDALPTQMPGTHTLTVTATDNAGNTSTSGVAYLVFTAFGDASGRLAPPPTVNTSIKAGAMVPVKFSLGGDQGLDIFETGYPRWKEVSCTTLADDPTSPSTPVEDGTASGLTYDAAAAQYNYKWKTEKAWYGECWQLSMLFSQSAGDYAGGRMHFSFRFDK